MEPTQELIDEIYWEKVDRGKLMTPGERFLYGPRLFDRGLALGLAGIRHQNPAADEARVHEIMAERLMICDDDLMEGKRVRGTMSYAK